MKNLLENINSMLPTYSVVLPFSKKEIKFTPFRVKDAKNISIVLQEQNNQLAIKAMIELLKNCAPELDPMELCLADAEYLFLIIRSKSVEENLNLLLNNKPILVNIYDIKTRNDLNSFEIKISPTLILKIEIPLIKDLIKFENITKKEIINASIKQVVLNNEIYKVNTFVTKEIEELLENLPLNVLKQLESIKFPELYINLKTDDHESEVCEPLTFFTFR